MTSNALEEGDLVFATVTKVAPHAAFIRLENYEGYEGLIHVSEISKTWVKNIKSHVSPNQKLVCKIIRINQDKKYVKCSIRRVSDYDKKAKWDQIRRENKVDNIFRIAAEKSKTKPDKIREKLAELENKHGDMFHVFEFIKKTGKAALKDIVPTGWVEPLWDTIDKSISESRVELSGVISLNSYAPDGISKIKKLLKSQNIVYLGSGKYKLDIEEEDYKKAEAKLAKIIKSIEKNLGKTEEFSFERDKK
ncbi:MAG: S1 RNA-binding domain-containing protein [Candidatus Altiarchaeota archaeon]|nr:S1 RNA-binding domain-containing protein [Candidatus Altiarchaeota archaeon]